MKKIITLFVLVFLISSTLVIAENDCSGLFGSIGCFLFGSSENRAGKGWFDRSGAIVGNAGGSGGDVLDPLVISEGETTLQDNDEKLQESLRILLGNDYDENNPDKNVRTFQEKNNLEVDGVAGKNTVTSLNNALQNVGSESSRRKPITSTYSKSTSKSTTESSATDNAKKDNYGVVQIVTGPKDKDGNIIKDNAKFTWELPDGTKLKDDEWEYNNGVFKNKLNEDQNIIVSDNRIFETNTKTNEEKITTIKGHGKQLTKTKEEKKGGKTTSLEIFDSNDRRIGTAKLDNNGEITSFEFYDSNGRLRGVCYDDACLSNPDGAAAIWVDTDNYCKGTKEECFKNGKLVPQGNDDACGSDPNRGYCKAIKAKEWESFLSGDTKVQVAIGSVLSYRASGRALSAWLFPEITAEWNKQVSNVFDNFMIGESVPSAICDMVVKGKSTEIEGQSSTFIEVGTGIVQFVGSINAEKNKNAAPMFCDENLECRIGECADDNICYKNNRVVMTNYYKISWGVSAPRDETFTPYIDENGIAIKYNVKLYGDQDIFLYPPDSTGTKSTLQLANGESDQDIFVAYSPLNYNKICIEFSAPPKNMYGAEVGNVCANFKNTEVGVLDWNFPKTGVLPAVNIDFELDSKLIPAPLRGEDYQSSTEQIESIKVSDVERKQI